MRHRRNSDEELRALVRRIAAGEHDLLPQAARIWERTQESRGLPDSLVTEIVHDFTVLEEALEEYAGPYDVLECFTDLDDYPELDESAGANYLIGELRGMSQALGLTIDDLWALSEKVRGGEGERLRDARTPPFCEECGEIPSESTDEHDPDCSMSGPMCRTHHVCSESDPDADSDAGGVESGRARCDNCRLVSPISALRVASDLYERMEEGGEEPAGECPACGALAYEIDEES